MKPLLFVAFALSVAPCFAAPTAVSTAQKGVAVAIDTRPLFAGFLNIDFPETQKFREQESLEGEFGQNVTELGNDLMSEVDGKLVVLPPEEGSPVPPSPFDVLTETNGGERSWLVLEVKRPRQAGKKLLVEVKLKLSEGVTLT